MPHTRHPDRYRFAGWELDVASGELRRGELQSGEATARLEPQPARVLVELVRRAGEVVPREALQRAVWGDAHVERDQGLNYCVRQIRAALGDEAAEPRFLETLPRRGYRFLVPAEAVPAAEPPPRRWRLPLAALALALGLAAILVVAWRMRAGDGPVRLALRPFAVVEASAAEVAALTPGAGRLDERLLAALVGVEGLDVVGPATTAARDLADADLTDPDLAATLGVDHVVSGAVRPATATAPGTVFAQLTRGRDGGHLFGRRFPFADLGDAGELERLCVEVVHELLVALEAEEGALVRPTPGELCRR